MRIIMLLAVLLLGFSGVARADDQRSSASMLLAQHGLAMAPQISQAGGNCANKCELASGTGGGPSCDLPGAGGTTCIPVGTGCTCSGQLINAMGVVAGTAVKK
jgi:hypothetical protein